MDGTGIESLSYDVFGKRRDATDWVGAAASAATEPRGYTGHEHMDDVDLIHMNGRVYDFMLGRMMSTDPVMSDRLNSQRYNGYSYVMNNPLKYTDLSGFDDTSWWGELLSAGYGCGFIASCGGSTADAFFDFIRSVKENKFEFEGILSNAKAREKAEREIRKKDSLTNYRDRENVKRVVTGGDGSKQYGDVEEIIVIGHESATSGLFGAAAPGSVQAPRIEQLSSEFKVSLVVAYALGKIGNSSAYVNLVKSGGDWDYKSRAEYANLKDIEAFGKFAFGATAAAYADGASGGLSNYFSGVTTSLILRGAGAYQEYKQQYDPSDGHWYDFSSPARSNYGDQFSDQFHIYQGAQYYFENGYQ